MSSSSENLVGKEQLELDALREVFERTPRIMKLLRYLGEKYFANETDQLTEYNIAVRVFERDPNTFIASEDAIVRVETHRLRKKLKAYYEAEGKDHQIHVSIPPGSYALLFYYQEAKSNPDAVPEQKAEETVGTPDLSVIEPAIALPLQVEKAPEEHHAGKWARRVLYGAVAGVLLLAVVWLLFRSHKYPPATPSVANQPGETAGVTLASGRVQIPLRMILGYYGPPQRDSVGDVWQADQFYDGGWSTPRPVPFLSRTSDQFLFHYGRYGDYKYNIPLAPGTYELHFYAVSPSTVPLSEDEQLNTVFRIEINGQTVLDSYDPVSDAMGINVADERVIRGVTPAQDGKLHLRISTVIGTPILNALAILPGPANKQLPIRITMQNTPWTDRNGQIWHPDNYFQGGRRRFHALPSAWIADAGLYSTERYGHFSYAIPVDPRDRYTVILHFVELFFGVNGSNTTGPGQRVFRVLCNGNTILNNFDIAQEVGSEHPLSKTFTHLKPTEQGKLNLTFEPIKNYATISSIEVLDESK
ncbi:malectin domain-containing carbohydrate-binding protein [Telmatobacter bradus]|uniref:malectin domain-containing carbohydrate-binding protein n=1 Tax=Telmatobacter bradus TaxID=474953 RepID=UPI003B4362BD